MCHCGKPITAKGLCRNHYNIEWRKRTGRLTPRKETSCHCGKKQVAKGLCSRHYSEMVRVTKPEQVKKYHDKYNNSQKKSAGRSRRRALIANAAGAHTHEELLRLRDSQRFCNSCESAFSYESPATVDHKVPLSRGGSNAIENLHLLCGKCNSQKKDKTWEEYLTWKTT